MRRNFVIALAFLTIALTGGTCEFRATSNNAIASDPRSGDSGEQRTGLVVVVSTGGSDADGGDATIEPAVIETVLATSVLSLPSRTSAASDDSSMPASLPGQVPLRSAIQANSSPVANPIPEPNGFWLFAAGSIALSWYLRGMRQSKSGYDESSSASVSVSSEAFSSGSASSSSAIQPPPSAL